VLKGAWGFNSPSRHKGGRFPPYLHSIFDTEPKIITEAAYPPLPPVL